MQTLVPRALHTTILFHQTLKQQRISSSNLGDMGPRPLQKTLWSIERLIQLELETFRKADDMFRYFLEKRQKTIKHCRRKKENHNQTRKQIREMQKWTKKLKSMHSSLHMSMMHTPGGLAECKVSAFSSESPCTKGLRMQTGESTR